MAAVNANRCAYASAGITAPIFAPPPPPPKKNNHEVYIFREIEFSYVL